MFSKGDNRSKTSSDPVPEKRTVDASSAPSIIADDTKIVGDLVGAGGLEVDGKVDGKIEVASLKIGESGEVKGGVTADSVRILGSMTGPVNAATISIAASAKVNSDLIHRSLSIEAGAKVEGQVRLAKRDKAESGGKGILSNPGEEEHVAGMAAAAKPNGGGSGGAPPG